MQAYTEARAKALCYFTKIESSLVLLQDRALRSRLMPLSLALSEDMQAIFQRNFVGLALIAEDPEAHAIIMDPSYCEILKDVFSLDEDSVGGEEPYKVLCKIRACAALILIHSIFDQKRAELFVNDATLPSKEILLQALSPLLIAPSTFIPPSTSEDKVFNIHHSATRALIKIFLLNSAESTLGLEEIAIAVARSDWSKGLNATFAKELKEELKNKLNVLYENAEMGGVSANGLH